MNKATDIDSDALARAENLLGYAPDAVERVRPPLGACELLLPRPEGTGDDVPQGPAKRSS